MIGVAWFHQSKCRKNFMALIKAATVLAYGKHNRHYLLTIRYAIAINALSQFIFLITT